MYGVGRRFILLVRGTIGSEAVSPRIKTTCIGEGDLSVEEQHPIESMQEEPGRCRLSIPLAVCEPRRKNVKWKGGGGGGGAVIIPFLTTHAPCGRKLLSVLVAQRARTSRCSKGRCARATLGILQPVTGSMNARMHASSEMSPTNVRASVHRVARHSDFRNPAAFRAMCCLATRGFHSGRAIGRLDTLPRVRCRVIHVDRTRARPRRYLLVSSTELRLRACLIPLLLPSFTAWRDNLEQCIDTVWRTREWGGGHGTSPNPHVCEFRGKDTQLSSHLQTRRAFAGGRPHLACVHQGQDARHAGWRPRRNAYPTRSSSMRGTVRMMEARWK